MNIRYTADWHINHKKILEYDNRPFKNIQEHDKGIIDIVNKYVMKEDCLFVLGDVLWSCNFESIDLLKEINCSNIYFTPGNHDGKSHVKRLEKLGWINIGLMYIDKTNRVVLSHYPIDEWYKASDENPFMHIHGHSHGNGAKKKNRIDVGLNFREVKRPISLYEIKYTLDDKSVLDIK